MQSQVYPSLEFGKEEIWLIKIWFSVKFIGKSGFSEMPKLPTCLGSAVEMPNSY